MAKVKKTRRPRAVYEKLMAQRRSEGLTYPELSVRSGIPVTTLQEWGRRLRKQVTTPKSDFVELTPSSPSAPVEIVLRGGRRLVLPTAKPPTGLAELVAVLEAC